MADTEADSAPMAIVQDAEAPVATKSTSSTAGTTDQSSSPAREAKESAPMDMDTTAPSTSAQSSAVTSAMKEAKELKENDVYCYVALRWARTWVEYTQCEAFWQLKPSGDGKGADPGPMDNSALLLKRGGRYPVVEIKRNLQAVRDYISVPLQVYKLWEAWYGGGPRIERKARAMSTGVIEPQVSVIKYPIHLVLLDVKKDGTPDHDTARRCELAPCDTFDEVLKLASADAATAENDAVDADAKDVSTEPELRLWYQSTNAPSIDEVSSTAVVLAGDEANDKWTMVLPAQNLLDLASFSFRPEANLILVERKIDGAWPRDAGEDWRALKVGDKVDSKDTVQKWLRAEVLEVKENQIKIHYIGHETKWDIWIDRNSERLAKQGTRAPEPKERSTAYTSSWSSSYGMGSRGTPVATGAVGLRNLGNTCFMNSTLQCMAQTPWLTQYFLDKNHVAEINRDNPLGHKGRIAEEYADLLQRMWGNEFSVVAPSGFKRAIGDFAPQFSGYNQQDSQELLAFLVDGLHEDLNRLKKKGYDPEPIKSDGKSDAALATITWNRHEKRHDSEILDHMGGMFRSNVICMGCKTHFRKFDPFLLTIPVPLPTSGTKSQTITLVSPDPTIKPRKLTVEVKRMIS